MKKLYEVANVYSGLSLGFIAAESEKEALDLVSKDAGYESYERACDATGTDELVAEEMDIEDLVDLVKSWIDQFMEENPNFRCMAQVQLSQIIANSNAPAFPTLPEEYIDEAHDIAWELFIEHWRGKIIDEFKEQGVNQEEIDANGEGIEQSILPDVLSGTPVSEAVQDWLEWKKQDLEEREKVEAQDAGATWMEDVLTWSENSEEWLGLNYQEFMQATANVDRPAFPTFETTMETDAAYQGAWKQLEFSRRLYAEDNIYQEDLVRRKEEDAQ